MSDDSDKARFTRMYEAHHKEVWKYVRRRAPELDAEAITQEVFLTAWRKLQSVPADAPLKWLYPTASHIMCNGFRGQQRRHEREILVGGYVPLQRSDSAEELVKRSAVHDALAALKEKDRLVLELVAFDGYNVSEVAKRLGMNRTTVAMRLFRLRNLWPLPEDPITDNADTHPLVRLIGRRPHA